MLLYFQSIVVDVLCNNIERIPIQYEMWEKVENHKIGPIMCCKHTLKVLNFCYLIRRTSHFCADSAPFVFQIFCNKFFYSRS